MTAAPRCASPIRPVRDAHLALGGHPCARPPLAPSACPIGPLASSAPLPHRPLASSAPCPFGAGVLGWGGHRQPAQCLGGLHPLIEAMHAPWMSHVRSTTARPKAWSRGTKTVLLLPPAEASVARSRGFSARRQHSQACDQLRIDPATAPTRPHQATGLAPIPRRRPTPLPAVVPPGSDRCALRSRCGNGG